MKRKSFVACRLRQLVREEMKRMDFEGFVRRIVREELYGRASEQQRPKLRLVK